MELQLGAAKQSSTKHPSTACAGRGRNEITAINQATSAARLGDIGVGRTMGSKLALGVAPSDEKSCMALMSESEEL